MFRLHCVQRVLSVAVHPSTPLRYAQDERMNAKSKGSGRADESCRKARDEPVNGGVEGLNTNRVRRASEPARYTRPVSVCARCYAVAGARSISSVVTRRS